MRKQLSQAAFVLMAVAGLAACSPGTTPTPSTTATAPTDGTSTAPTGTPSPDAETKTPAPAPSAASATPGPGLGNAELAISVKPSASGTPANFTLVCVDGVPSAESQHPNAAAACTALKNDAALLSPQPRPKDQACTQQYGGPQEATVTGVVDGRPVETTFSLRDGCEISAWNAAKDVLGSTGGAV
ncbi:SSI family serine proteinase inhibitor [Arthrobacter sp. AL08]|uniref:SSI family serine proteinase inhibitor n=1 Tax=Micrococcaceae TaxID=1268 RepID=UPI001CFF784F|nr:MULTISPECIES: SSI family serine proteinase inhibitor [Micrococcaceae]MCB5281246.1 subtilase-type protease inhibitor [Arthrobacter sp. ES1]MDI3241160.1 SSI family serine proteinase inhibitor [Arthrobacter sp. AL05]MDI3276864.1 SSI family serine proteinase inhibitor [Arthrobacter sp. AL08]MDJ0352996.1 SSI family serine proteinase inhibitor [Pseudarthrobacter sp. PH31-O2]WGZ79782.1 SSI family serine proteinase inhibitor [Arthrobacter sp. EM1]